MLISSIIFITVLVAGIAFWFYNRRQVESLVNNIDDKQAIINALQTHVESVQPTNNNTPNGNKKRNGGNKNKKKKNPIPFNPESEVIIDLRQEKKNRPKPRRKPKTQQ